MRSSVALARSPTRILTSCLVYASCPNIHNTHPSLGARARVHISLSQAASNESSGNGSIMSGYGHNILGAIFRRAGATFPSSTARQRLPVPTLSILSALCTADKATRVLVGRPFLNTASLSPYRTSSSQQSAFGTSLQHVTTLAGGFQEMLSVSCRCTTRLYHGQTRDKTAVTPCQHDYLQHLRWHRSLQGRQHTQRSGYSDKHSESQHKKRFGDRVKVREDPQSQRSAKETGSSKAIRDPNVSKHLVDRLPAISQIHRPSKEELLAAATGFWSRLKVRFKWFSIRSGRPFNIDEISAFFSWVLVGHVLWIILGTTTFFSLAILAVNTVFAQGSLYIILIY